MQKILSIILLLTIIHPLYPSYKLIECTNNKKMVTDAYVWLGNTKVRHNARFTISENKLKELIRLPENKKRIRNFRPKSQFYASNKKISFIGWSKNAKITENYETKILNNIIQKAESQLRKNF